MRERGVLGRCRRHLRWLKRPAWPMGCVGGVQGRGGRGMSPTVVLYTRMWPLNTPPPGLREPPGRAPTDDAPCASRPRLAAWRGPWYVVRVGPVSAPLAAPLADWGGEPRSAAARCDWTSSAVAERVCGSDVRVRQLLVPVPRDCGDTESTHFYWSGASMDAVPLPAEAPHCLLKAGANRLQPVDLPVAEVAGGSPWRAF